MCDLLPHQENLCCDVSVKVMPAFIINKYIWLKHDKSLLIIHVKSKIFVLNWWAILLQEMIQGIGLLLIINTFPSNVSELIQTQPGERRRRVDVGNFCSRGPDAVHILSTGISLVRSQSHDHSDGKGDWQMLSSCAARRRRNQVW